MLEYGGAEIQILDLPGIIEGAAEGKGRGRQVISAAKVRRECFNILHHESTDLEASDI